MRRIHAYERAERIADKAAELRSQDNAYGKKGAMEWTSNGVRFAIERSWLQGKMVQFVVSAYRGEERLDLKDANPFGFVNPTLTTTSADGDHEDLEGALKSIIESAVLMVDKKRSR